MDQNQLVEAQAALVAGWTPVQVVQAVHEATGLSHVDAMNTMLSAGVKGLLPFMGCPSCGAACGRKCKPA